MRADNVSRDLKLNNKGISLVELLVALLILAIIVVPLMSLFSRAAKVNTFNTERANADIVAQNIIEAIKVYGLEETAKQVHDYLPGVAGSKCLGMEPEDVQDESFSYESNFIQNSSNIYKYSLTGVQEGALKYNVAIEFDSNYEVSITPDPDDPSASTTKDINDVTVYDLSAFNEKTTVFINPMSGAVYYDEEALNTIFEENERMQETLFETAYATVADWNASELRKEQQSILDHEDPVYVPKISPYPVQSSYPPVYPHEFVDKLERTMIVDISQENVSDAGVAKRVYKVNSVLDYYIPAGSNIVSDEPKSIEKSGYCHDVTIDDINTIYVMYTPFPYMCKSAFDQTEWDRLNTAHNNTPPSLLNLYRTDDLLINKTGDANKISFNSEKIKVVNHTGKNIEVYIIVQGNAGMKFSSDLATEIVNTGSGSVELYSQAELAGSVGSTHNGIMKEKSAGHQDKLVNVKVTVWNDDVQRTIESTIQR